MKDDKYKSWKHVNYSDHAYADVIDGEYDDLNESVKDEKIKHRPKNMKTLREYVTEANGEVRNRKFLKLMKDAGLEKVLLCKGDGYYYITSDDDDTFSIINSVMDTSIYVYAFNHQSPEQWVEDIKYLLKDTKLVK